MHLRKDPDILYTKSLVLFGCGGHARSVADILLMLSPHAELLFVDEKALPQEKILGFPVQSTPPSDMEACFLAIGDNAARKRMWELYHSQALVTVIAPSAHRGVHSRISRGVFIGNRAHIGPEAEIGENTIINNGAIIEHEVVVGAHSHIGPNAVISGRSRIGDEVFIGVGATVKDGIEIGSQVLVGAGAVVVKDLLQPGIYVGNPAKVLEKRGTKKG